MRVILYSLLISLFFIACEEELDRPTNSFYDPPSICKRIVSQTQLGDDGTGPNYYEYEKRTFNYLTDGSMKEVINDSDRVDSLHHFYDEKGRPAYTLRLGSGFPDTVRSYSYYPNSQLKSYSKIFMNNGSDFRTVLQYHYKNVTLDSATIIFMGADTIRGIDPYKIETKNGNVTKIFALRYVNGQLTFTLIYSASYDPNRYYNKEHHLDFYIFPGIESLNLVLADTIHTSTYIDVYQHDYEFDELGRVSKRSIVRQDFYNYSIQYQYDCD